MTRQKRRIKLGLVLGAVACVLALPSVAGAQAAPTPPPGWEEFAIKRANPGDPIKLTGSGCTEGGEPGWVAGVIGHFNYAGDDLGSYDIEPVQADETGAWKLEGMTPGSPADAFYFVIAACSNDTTYWDQAYVAVVGDPYPKDPTPTTEPPSGDDEGENFGDDAQDNADKKSDAPTPAKVSPRFTG